jgi:hypothetical protein
VGIHEYLLPGILPLSTIRWILFYVNRQVRGANPDGKGRQMGESLQLLPVVDFRRNRAPYLRKRA